MWLDIQFILSVINYNLISNPLFVYRNVRGVISYSIALNIYPPIKLMKEEMYVGWHIPFFKFIKKLILTHDLLSFFVWRDDVSILEGTSRLMSFSSDTLSCILHSCQSSPFCLTNYIF
jgi:hypothetical protein